MKTIIIYVRDLLSPLSAPGVEKQLAKLPGVKQVDVNNVSGSAMVLYDETVTDLNAIKTKVRECGHHCGGELVPKHLCGHEHPVGHAQVMANPARDASISATPSSRHGEHSAHVNTAGSASHTKMLKRTKLAGIHLSSRTAAPAALPMPT